MWPRREMRDAVYGVAAARAYMPASAVSAPPIPPPVAVIALARR
jgi:hypothetical protein